MPPAAKINFLIHFQDAKPKIHFFLSCRYSPGTQLVVQSSKFGTRYAQGCLCTTSERRVMKVSFEHQDFGPNVVYYFFYKYEGGVYNNNINAGPAGTGGSEKLKSSIDDKGAQGREKMIPATICCGKKKRKKRTFQPFRNQTIPKIKIQAKSYFETLKFHISEFGNLLDWTLSFM